MAYDGTGAGQVVIKGLESERRNEAPIVRAVVKGVLTRCLADRDAAATIAFVKASIARLLRGEVNFDELTFTAALWRENPADIKKYAAAMKKTEGVGTAMSRVGGGRGMGACLGESVDKQSMFDARKERETA